MDRRGFLRAALALFGAAAGAVAAIAPAAAASSELPPGNLLFVYDPIGAGGVEITTVGMVAHNSGPGRAPVITIYDLRPARRWRAADAPAEWAR